MEYETKTEVARKKIGAKSKMTLRERRVKQHVLLLRGKNVSDPISCCEAHIVSDPAKKDEM